MEIEHVEATYFQIQIQRNLASRKPPWLLVLEVRYTLTRLN